MSRAVRVKVRPGQALRFPAQCVYCGRRPNRRYACAGVSGA
jgi:hypothetical protein